MVMPGYKMSSTPALADLLAPRDVVKGLLVGYERGGIHTGDISAGFDYQDWQLYMVGDDVTLKGMTSLDESVLFTLAGITELDLAFDQLMHPFVVYVVNGIPKYWWWDPVLQLTTHALLPGDAVNPRCTLDDKRFFAVSQSDVLIMYVRAGHLRMRVQRDRFGTEYDMASGVAVIERIGMGVNNRLQVVFTQADVPEVVGPPPEMTIPYWSDFGGGWIDLSKCLNVTFASVYQYEVDGPDFQWNQTVAEDIASIHYPYAASFNSTDGGQRMRILDSSECANAVIAIVDSDGLIIEKALYASGADSDWVNIPTGIDAYVVTDSDTNRATVYKEDTTVVDAVGAVDFASVFGQDFWTQQNHTATLIIPFGGLAIKIEPPLSITASVLQLKAVAVAGASADQLGAVNQKILDFTSGAWWHFYSGGTGYIQCGMYHYLDPNDTSVANINLVPGSTYFFNVKNLHPSNPNWVKLVATWIEG